MLSVRRESSRWSRDRILSTRIAGAKAWRVALRNGSEEEEWQILLFLVREEASGCKSRGWFHCPLGDCPCVLAFTDPSALFRPRRCSRKDIYKPPLATDIEKMKTTHLKEQKAFAFIREILGRQPRSPTSSLPTRWLSAQT